MRAIGLLGLLVGGAYLVWRAGWTINTSALWLAIPLLAAEIHGYVTFVLFFFMTWKLPELPKGARPPSATVDFYIPTYNEPYEVLALTIAGATAVRGAHETYVLDDGRRDWVRKLTESCGAHYLTRGGNAGAKAGNINEALGRTTGQFVAIVDADMVPAPSFLEETLGYFSDSDVALVQGPQEFYNKDSFQHAGDGTDWHEQSTFYRVIQPGKNRWNAAFWCGSPSIVRRAALESVGGVAVESITEDLHTALRLHRRGWKTVYHDAVIARGVAPEDYNAFIIQRLRWAQGAMQVIRREWRMSGLSVAQRLNYVASTGTYFDAYRKLVMLLIVPAILLTDQVPISFDGPTFLAVWGIQFAVMFAANVALGRGHYRYFRTEAFDLMKMFAFINASLVLVVERTLAFRVTPKAQPGKRHVHPLVLPYVAVVGVYVVALAVGAARLHGDVFATGNREAIIAAMCWAGLISCVLAGLTLHTYRHVTRRRAHRFRVDLPARVVTGAGQAVNARVRDLTLLGASFVAPVTLEPGERVAISVPSIRVELDAVVRGSWLSGDEATVGVQLESDEHSRAALASYLARQLFSRDIPNRPPVEIRAPREALPAA